MPIAAVFEFPGEDIAKYKSIFEAEPKVIDQPQRLHHVCFQTEDGWTVVDVWEDEDSFRAFGDVLGPAAVGAGLAPEPKVYPVAGTITQDGLFASYWG
jgi:hypothetical protein